MKTRYLVLIVVAMIALSIGICFALHFTIKPKAATPNDSSYREIDEAITKGKDKDKESEKSSSKSTLTPKPTTKKEEVTPSPKREESAKTEDQSNAKVEEYPTDNSTGKNYDYYYGDGGGNGTNYDYYYGYDSGSYSWTNYDYYYN